MSFTYNKRMSNYQAMLPITPNNFHLKHHNIRGGDLTATSTTTPPAPPAPLIPLATLPETVSDWMNMSNDDLHRLTPANINQLSNASFETAFGGTRPLGNLMAHRVLNNASNSQLINTAISNRLDIIRKSRARGGDLTASPAPPSTTQATPTATPLPQTVQDWQNMSDDELLKLTPADINNLSDASFTAAFTGTLPLGNTILHVVEGAWGANTPSQALMVTAIRTRQSNMSFWLSPSDPLWKTQLTGIPSFWLQHPNQYTHALSQNVMYGAYQDFQDTSFYTKYNTRIKSITPPRKFARYMNSEIPGSERNSMGAANSTAYLDAILAQYGQKWRVMFFQGDLSGRMVRGNDYYVYYIDSTGLNDYLDMLQEFYNDRDTIQPQEVIIMLNKQYRAALAAKEAALERQYYSEGYSAGEAAQKAADEAAEEASKEASEDSSSSIWGDIGEGLEVASMFI